MRTRTKKRLTIVAVMLVALFTLATLALHSVGLMFTEDLYYSEGSYSDFLLTPRDLSTMPLSGLVGKPRYYSSCGDGPKPPMNGISYGSALPPGEVKNEIASHFRRRGYEGDSLLELRRDDRTLDFGVEPISSGGSTVDLTIVYSP